MASEMVLGDWQQWLPNVIITCIFAWMVYVLLNIVLNFREENLRVTRSTQEVQASEDEVGVCRGAAMSSENSEMNAELGWEGEGTHETEALSQRVEEELGRPVTGSHVHDGKEGRRLSEAAIGAGPSLDGDNCEDDGELMVREGRGENVSRGSQGAPGLSGLQHSEAEITTSLAHSQAEFVNKSGFGRGHDLTHVPSLDRPQAPGSSLVTKLSDQPVGGQEKIDVKDEKANSREEDSDEEDWEGVETSDLENAFNAAATLVTTLAVGQGPKFSQDVQLLLYGLYKQATEGPCDVPQPSIFNPKARAKWDAWKKQTDMKQEDAMESYIHLVGQICPGWSERAASGSQGSGDGEEGHEAAAEGQAKKGALGPVFSSLAEAGGEAAQEGSLQGLQACASEGDVDGLVRLLAQGTAINAADEEGRTALHWAADRGHVDAVRLLLRRGAAVNAPDGEGQTALHYAAVCEHEELARVLLHHGADPQAADREGATCASLRPSSWAWPSAS